MAIKVDLIETQAEGYHLRWFENGVRRGESTGTADKVQAESLLTRRWAELNGIVAGHL